MDQPVWNGLILISIIYPYMYTHCTCSPRPVMFVMRRFQATVLSLLLFGFENALSTWTLVDMLCVVKGDRLQSYKTFQHQWITQLLRIFGPKLIRINLLIKTVRSAGFFFPASVAKFWKHDISSASERAFPGFFGDIFSCSTLSKKRCFSTEEFTRFLSTVSSQRRATRSDVSFQT